MKDDLLDWVTHNRRHLQKHHLYATGTNGKLLSELLSIPITLFKSGPLGGDQQIGAAIADQKIDFLIFFWDPLEALSQIRILRLYYGLPWYGTSRMACNRSSADYLITSSLMESDYQRVIPDYQDYLNRDIHNLP